MLNNLKLHFKLYFLIAAIYYKYKFCSYHAKKYLIFAYVCVFLLQKIFAQMSKCVQCYFDGLCDIRVRLFIAAKV